MSDSQGPNMSKHDLVRPILLLGALIITGGIFLWSKTRSIEPPAPLNSPASPLSQQQLAIDPLDWADLPDRVEATRVSIDDDPTQDGWDTEYLQSQAHHQLDVIAHWIIEPTTLTREQVVQLVGENFSCEVLRPKLLASVYKSASVEIFRPEGKDPRQYRGAAGLVEALQGLVQPMMDARKRGAEFHVFRVQLLEAAFSTQQFLTLTAGSNAEVNATWTCHWSMPVGDIPPQLLSIKVDTFEQAQVALGDKHLFADCTVAALGHNRSFKKQITRGINHWARRIEYPLGTDMLGGIALAVGDVNGDGMDDVYLAQSGGLPNRLYIQKSDGTFDDQSAAAGVDWLERSGSVLIVDLDNDGDQDMAICCDNTLLLMSNNGHGRFTLEKRMVMQDSPQSISAVDYDNDGYLDLYIMVYYGSKDSIGEYPVAIPYHDANNGGRNTMYRNDSDWVFTDVTEQVGLDADNMRFSITASWEDYDNDGDQDVYIANDFGRNNLYRNDDGHFVNVAQQAGVEDIAAGMSVSWADYNRDGLMDIYVGNMFSSAGNRVTYQRRFKEGIENQALDQYRHHARGSTLFENLGDDTFADVSVKTGLTMGRWAWASLFADLNNDGWDDVLIMNGNITGYDADDL
jgi:hypothetical protein